MRDSMQFRDGAMLLLRVLIGLAATAATGVVLVGQLGRTHHTIDQINTLLPLLLPGLALALAAGLRARDRVTVAIAIIGLAVGGVHFGGAIWPGLTATQDASAPSLKVMTYSTYHSNPAPGSIPAMIAAEAPDVVVLQETNASAAPVIETLLPGYYRLLSCSQPKCPLTIFSRWPVRKATVDFDGRGKHLDSLVAEVRAPFGAFRIIDVHLPRPYTKDYHVAFDALAELAQSGPPMPTIVAGDFNTATASFGLNRFAASSGLHRQDAFIPTYPANRVVPAFVGIDHIFADDNWARAGCARTGGAHSDHYGIACRLRFLAAR